MNRDLDRYSTDYHANYGFEEVLVDYRRRVVMEHVVALGPEVVVEVGCGPDLLYGHYLRTHRPVDWTIVEPSRRWSAQAQAQGLPGLRMVEGFLEQSVDRVLAGLPRKPDLVICSGVLQEVPSAKEFLAALHALMGARSVLHLNVANAHSFHRRLGVAMGAIATVHSMSERNILMQQHRVYDRESLAADLRQSGFGVESSGGYLVKPFTHAQMEAVSASLGSAVMDGLYELGRREPDLACEIFVNARVAP